MFVFAITRVTSLMAHGLSWTSIGQGLLVLAALWCGWAAYAWLTNHVAGEDFRARLVVFTAGCRPSSGSPRWRSTTAGRW